MVVLSDILWSHTLRPGGKWSGVISRGKLIKVTALDAGACLSMLLYNAWDRTERYNMPDTLKAQHVVFLTAGNILMTDNGRAMASIVDDTLGWHDTIGGYSSRRHIDSHFGKTRYQDQRNEWFRSAEENFSVELVRNALDRRDLTAPVNLFAKVSPDSEGHLTFDVNHCPPGSHVTLRTEMDVLIIFSNTPHPLDPRLPYPAAQVRLNIQTADPIDEKEDLCVGHCSENRRAFENTWAYCQLGR